MHTLSDAGRAGLHGDEHELVDLKGRTISISLNALSRLAEQLCGERPVRTSNRRESATRTPYQLQLIDLDVGELELALATAEARRAGGAATATPAQVLVGARAAAVQKARAENREGVTAAPDAGGDARLAEPARLMFR